MMPRIPAAITMPAGAGTLPAATGTSTRAGGSDLPGAAAPGQFAELFASLLPVSAPRQEAEASARPAMEPAVAPAGAAAAGEPAAESGDLAAPAPETKGATAEDLLLAQRAHYPTLVSVEATPDAAVPSSTRMAPATNEPASPVQTEIPSSQVPGDRAGSDPLATGSAARASFPVAIAPLLILPLPGVPTPETAAPSQVSPLPVAEAPLLNLPKPGMPTPETDNPAQVLPLSLAKAPLLVIEMPQSADSTPGAPELVDAVAESASPDARQLAPTASLADTMPGMAPVQVTAFDASSPVVPVAPAGTSGGPFAAGQETPAGDVAPPVATTGGVPADSVPEAAPPAPVSTPAISVHAVGQAAEQGTASTTRPSNARVVGAIDSIEVPSATAPPARTETPPPLHRQLLGPIATLAAGPHGERTLSVNIAPEALGPITVKAHLGSEGIRMDLTAPTEAGREALRAMLPELRRELVAAGGGSITVGTGSEASATAGGNKGQEQAADGEHRSSAGSGIQPLPVSAGQRPETPRQDTPLTQNVASHLDVMA